MQHGEGHVARGGAGQLVVAEEPVGQARGARHHLVALLRPERGEVRLEELAHDAVGELLLEIGAAGYEHLEADLGRERPRLGYQSRLAHPGATLDRDQAAGARLRGFDHGMQSGELDLTLQQRRA